MSSILDGFNPVEHYQEPKTFELLPGGDYVAMAVDSVEDDNSKGTGRFLKVEFQILETPQGAESFKGRTVSDWFNLQHNNAETVEIARKKYAALCHAADVTDPGMKPEDLHNIPVILIVAQEVRRDTGKLSNKIKKYRAKNPGVNPGPGGNRGKAVAKAATQADSNVPPWERE